MNKKQKIISLFLAILMVFQTIIWCPITVSAADSATTEGKLVFPDGRADIGYTSKLKDNKDGSFTLTIDLVARYAETQTNPHQRVTKSGSYTVERDGYYLLELWGGNGGTVDGGGNGGAGGYVYAKVKLKAGQVLHYSIGGNGLSTSSTHYGGGANGGGNSGPQTNTTVGGGGDYSAVILLDENETYTDDARKNNVILIAGGGGGGGAASGSDGGNAGSYSANHNSTATLISGYIYNGVNGKTGGNSSNYGGIAGTDVPGEVRGTLTGDLLGAVGSTPNDWFVTDNGGAGGSGNLGGGGGGAGYCGASGGIQTSTLWASNIGGGGGGSSFISDKTERPTSSEATEYLEGTNPNDVGGALVITFLEDKPVDYLDSVEVSVDHSKYYNVAVSSTKGTVADPSKISVTGIDLSIPDGETKGDTATITVIFTPKSGFAGGYNVPLFDGETSTLSTVCKEKASGNVLYEKTMDIGAKCSAVNAPLNFTVSAASIQLQPDEDDNFSFSTDELYEDNYAAVRGELSSHWQYDFIDGIGNYTVTSDGEIVSGVNTIDTTTLYDVGFTVTPKSDRGKAEVGSIGDTRFSKTVKAFVMSTGKSVLCDNEVSYSKTMTHNGSNYVLSVKIKSHIENKVLTNSSDVEAVTDKTVTYESSSEEFLAFTVPDGGDGYYYLQCIGGTGGTGRDEGHISGGPGNGASGGNVYGYVYLQEGDKIYYKLGANGASGVDNNGADFSYIKLERNDNWEYLIIAGGGGGGGHSVGWVTGGNDAVENTDDPSDKLEAEMSKYSGGNGSEGAFLTSGEAGTSGSNYRNPIVLETAPTNGSGESQGASGSASAGTAGGGFHSECVYLPSGEETVARQAQLLAGYTFVQNITEYFRVENISYSGLKNTPTSTFEDTTNKNGLITIATLNPTVTTTSEEYIKDGVPKGTVYTSEVEFVIEFVISTRDGFLGGNDVPVIEPGGDDLPTGMRLGQTVNNGSQEISGHFDLDQMDMSDYVNVDIPYSADGSDMTVGDAYYVIGDTPGVSKDELVQFGGAGSLPEVTEDWQDDYVDIVNNISTQPDYYKPSVTTDYTFEYGVKPKTDSTKAAVIEPVEAMTGSKVATIYVQAPVTYKLHNVEVVTPEIGDDGRYLTDYIYSTGAQSDYVTTLKTPSGYTLPDSVTVKVGGTEISDYSYDKSTGEIIVNAAAIKGEVEITVTTTLTLTYIYENNDGTVGSQQVTGLSAGDEIDMTIPNGIKANANKIGYTFTWDFSMLEGSDGNYTMPAGDAWVYGAFTANEYNIVINYVNTNGNTVATSVNSTVTYGETYNFLSPEVDGYAPDIPVLSGVLEYKNGTYYIGDNRAASVSGTTLTFTVTYTSTKGTLTIYYINKLTNSEVAEPHIEKINNNNKFSVKSPTVYGYTPDKETVTGTMDNNGETIYVYYTPKNVVVSFFDANGGTIGDIPSSKVVQFDNVYGYNAETGNYDGLPYPTKAGGFTFVGWYLADEEGNAILDSNGNIIYIDDESTVTIEKNHRLIAQWDPPVVYVMLSWGALDFTYDPGEWNPTTHLYDYKINTESKSNFQPTGTNEITVTNGYFDADDPSKNIASDIPVSVEFSYTSYDAYKDSIGINFTNTSTSTVINSVLPVDKVNGNNTLTVSVDPYLVNGQPLANTSAGTITIGICKVKISAIGGTSQ